MAWGSSKKTTSKSKPASKSKTKKVKKKYSLNDRYNYHRKKGTDYSKGYVHGLERGEPDNIERMSSGFQKGNANALKAQRNIYDVKY